jgi:hypothetical protein
MFLKKAFTRENPACVPLRKAQACVFDEEPDFWKVFWFLKLAISLNEKFLVSRRNEVNPNALHQMTHLGKPSE